MTRAWLAAALLAALAAAPVRASEFPPGAVEHAPEVLLEAPVRVVARVANLSPEIYVARLDVSRGARRFELRTVVQLADPDTGYAVALARLRESMGWKDRYFFVATHCGPGNIWKCASEAVFTLAKGELVGLGRLAVWGDDAFGTSYANGAFRDLDSDLEINDLLSHAASPRIDVVLREQDGTLVGDSAATWTLNAEQFALNDSLAKVRTEPDIVGYRRVWELVITPRLENAMLAKFCGRTATLDAIVAEAKRVLPAEAMAQFVPLLGRVTPLALPARSHLEPAADH